VSEDEPTEYCQACDGAGGWEVFIPESQKFEFCECPICDGSGLSPSPDRGVDDSTECGGVDTNNPAEAEV
jgi:hypothetical protein